MTKFPKIEDKQVNEIYEKEDLDFSPEIIQSGATKAIVALCFKKQ